MNTSTRLPCATRRLMPVTAAMLTVALHLNGCATPRADVAPVRNAWLGAGYEEVVTKWGTPVRSTSFNDGRQVYTWLSESVTSRGSVRPSIGVSAGSGMGVGVGIGVTSGPGRDAHVTCERTLIFRDGRVVDQSWFGPADYCATFRR